MVISMSASEVRKIRTKLGLTQTELADRLGVTQAAVSMWEDGKRVCRGPAAKMLKALSDASKKNLANAC